jgi:tetratricopeptide (TPR) repeat protein
MKDRLDAMKAQPAVEANLRSTLGNVYADLGDYPDAAQMHRQALLLRKNSLGDAHPDVAQSLNDLAQVLYLQGNYPDAESLHRQALALRKQLFGNQSLEVATSLHNLAETLRRERQPQTLAEADGLFREALAMRKTASEGRFDFVIDA